MTIGEEKKINIPEQNKLRKDIFLYTLLFFIAAFTCYIFFYLYGKTFIKYTPNNADGLTQTYTTYLSIKHMLQNLLDGKGISSWTWALGLGGDTFEYYGYKLFNPLTYFIIAFPDNLIDVGYSIANILRQYLAGFTFLLCAREMRFGSMQSLVGAISYAFSGWMVEIVFNQGSFENIAILFPLLVMGTEKFFNKKSPVLFIISVALSVASGVLWTYIAGIMTMLYYLARYHDYREEKGLLAFVKTTGKYCFYGITGILISSPFILSILCSMIGATTDTGATTNLAFYRLEKYLSIPQGLFKYTEVGATSYSYIFVSIICVCLMPLIVKSVKNKSTIAGIAMALGVLSLFPATSKVLNGFSYPAGRWYFVLIFFIVLATMECLSKEYLSDRENIKKMTIWIIIVSILSAAFTVFENGVNAEIIASIAGLVLGLLFIKIAASYFSKSIHSKGLIIAGTIILLISVSCPAAGRTYPKISNYLDQYLSVGESEERLQTSSEKIANRLSWIDPSFYRVDQAYRVNKNMNTKLKTNANIVYNSNSIYTYTSLVDSKWSKFNKVLGNNYGYFSRTTVVSNDNRPAMDYLLGVKYYLGDNEYEKTASRYAGYGYENKRTVAGVDVLKKENSIGLGMALDQYITLSELLEYPELVRDQVMLQAIVVPDSKDDLMNGIKHANKDDIKTEIYEIGSKVIGTSGNTEINGNRIRVEDGTGKIVLRRDVAENCQIVLSLQNFRKENDDSGEDTFKLIARSKGIKKYVYCEKNTPRGFNDVRNYNLNMGRNENLSNTIRLYIKTPGTYTFDSVKIYAIPKTVVGDRAYKLQETSFQIPYFNRNKSKVSSRVKVKKNSMLYLSIPYDRGWKAYVDGKEAEIFSDVNIAFMGIKLTPGNHRIALIYSHWGMKYALIGTAVGIFLLVIIVAYWRRKTYE